MKISHCLFVPFTLIAAGALTGCSSVPAKSADIAVDLRHSLDLAGMKNVSVRQDRDKGVITLAGYVATDSDKVHAGSIAASAAGGQVVANQIEVAPVGGEKDARSINTDLDQGIGKNLDAVLIQAGLRKNISFAVRSQVVTLKGDVNSESARKQTEQIATSVPNVQQVVNELQVKNQKATSD